MVSLGGPGKVSILRVKRKRDAEPMDLFTVSKKSKEDQKAVYKLLETNQDGSVNKINSEAAPFQIFDVLEDYEPVYCNLSQMVREHLNVEDYVYDIYVENKSMDYCADLHFCKEFKEDDLILLQDEESVEGLEEEDYDSNAEDYEGNDYPDEDWECSEENSSIYSYQEQGLSDDEF